MDIQPNAEKVAKRENVDHDDPNALRVAASRLMQLSAAAREVAETFRDRRSYPTDPEGEFTSDELKARVSYHSNRAGKLQRDAKALELRARELRRENR